MKHHTIKLLKSLSAYNLKLLCYIVYKQNTIKKEKEIEHFLLTALSFINQDTKVYINGMWKEFPDYRINRDGTKVYNIKKKVIRKLNKNARFYKYINN